jgi:integrase
VRELAGRLAPATVAKAVNVLSLILAAAVRSQLLVVNPCAGLMLPSNRRAGDSILTVTRDEFAGKLLPVVPVEHRAIVSMAAGCGLRWGECAGLPWDAVDLDDAEVHVRQVVVVLSGRLDLRPYPKTRAGRRTVPMPGFVVAALRAHLGDRQPVGLAFGTKTGTSLRRSNFRRQAWAPAVERSGLPAGLRFHDLRHGYATWLVSDGVPINVVSRLMGHEQISTTLNRYTHDARDHADLRVRAVFAGLAADDLLTSGES